MGFQLLFAVAQNGRQLVSGATDFEDQQTLVVGLAEFLDQSRVVDEAVNQRLVFGPGVRLDVVDVKVKQLRAQPADQFVVDVVVGLDPGRSSFFSRFDAGSSAYSFWWPTSIVAPT